MTQGKQDKQGLASRAASVWLLDQVLGEGRLMSELQTAPRLMDLSGPERARAQRLAGDTLRWLERADKILKRHLRKAPALHVMNILRLGTVELAQGEAAHGVVATLVELAARHKRHGALKGLVNAVLRKVATGLPEDWDVLRTPRLPKWLRVPLVEAWGAEAMAGIERAHTAGAPLDITVKNRPDHWAKVLGGMVTPTGSVRLLEAGQVSALAGFADGAWWVQDAAAALPARILGATQGETVLDLCAAPGGKTMQLAETGAKVTAIDASATRMKRMEENLKRTGLSAELLVQSVFDTQGSWDSILLDAPCSATGTMRRHPDLPHAKDGSGFADLIAMQTDMIDHAWSLLKPGGRMVFCTCSLLPDEGEVQIEEALERHNDMTTDPAAVARPGIDENWVDVLGGLRLRPDFWAELGGMDGFYMVCLRKMQRNA